MLAAVSVVGHCEHCNILKLFLNTCAVFISTVKVMRYKASHPSMVTHMTCSALPGGCEHGPMIVILSYSITPVGQPCATPVAAVRPTVLH